MKLISVEITILINFPFPPFLVHKDFRIPLITSSLTFKSPYEIQNPKYSLL